MALRRLQKDRVYRFYLAHSLAFANWQTPTVAELNANPTNDPNGLIFNITCAVNQDGTTFNLDDPDLDDSLSFCQESGSSESMALNPDVTLEIFRSDAPWTNAASATSGAGFNSANLAFTLLAWRGVEYFALMSVGKADDAPFAVGDRIKMAEIATDYGVDVLASGENIRMSQDTARRSRVNWNYKVAA